MLSYILKRLLLMIPTLFGVLLVTFMIVQFVPCLLYTSPSPRD